MTQSDHFTAMGARTLVKVNQSSNTALSATSESDKVIFSYDATAGTYSVMFGPNQTFGPDDAVASPLQGGTAFLKSSGGVTDSLILITKNRWSDIPNQYVGAGFWERTFEDEPNFNGSIFSSFIYGQPTAPSSIPTTGQLYFVTDVHGRVTSLGSEPRWFDGMDGYFIADLGLGTFTTVTNVSERDPIGGGGTSGALYLRAGGLISSNGAFEGAFFYSGSRAGVGGTVTGAFFGPSAEELGATFGGSMSDGSSVSGALTARQPTTPEYRNTRLDQLVVPELFYMDSVEVVLFGGSGALNVNASFRDGYIKHFTGGEFTFAAPTSMFYSADFSDGDIIDNTDPDFVRYETIVNDTVLKLALGRLGDPNAQVELTYTGFGMYESVGASQPSNVGFIPFVYGVVTPDGVASARTGSARYTGIAYGAAARPDQLGIYEVNGTSTFDVDFSNHSLNGYLVLAGKRTDGPGSVNFGQFNFSTTLPGDRIYGDFILGSEDLGDFTGMFFGPYAQEIGGRFTISSQGYIIGGVAVARQK